VQKAPCAVLTVRETAPPDEKKEATTAAGFVLI
jgi:hypothetical protein